MTVTQADALEPTSDAEHPTRLTRLETWLRGALTRLGEIDRIDLAAVMTCLVLAFHSARTPNDLMGALAVAGLLYRPWRQSSVFWLVAFTMRIAYQLPEHWWSIDNHQYLLTWWCLALALGFRARRPFDVFNLTTRLLIGLCFLYATVWKVISPDFLDGTFLHWTFVSDNRFAAFSESFLGLDDGGSQRNRMALNSIRRAGDNFGDPVLIATGSAVRPMAIILAWWTVFIEGLIAVAYLWPRERSRLARLRSPALLLFILTTYAIAPVTGFARTLLAMSVLAVRVRQRWWIATAVVTFVVVALFSRFDDLFARFSF